MERGFYYWKTNVTVSPYEDSVLEGLDAKSLYVRFFDVDVDPSGKEAKPLAIANFGHRLPKQKIVPVVFITPRALAMMHRNNITDYAKKIARLIQKKADEIALLPEEIQIDCDWSKSNRNIYFSLLEALKEQNYFQNKTLSVTIRLYQGKYGLLTGIPPADKGLLMVYNMDALTDPFIENSIISYSTAKDYLKGIGNYPLPLDVALPIYSWTLQFSDGNLKNILRDIRYEDLMKDSIFEREKENTYRVRRDTLLKNYPLKKGELIRHESSPFKTVHKVAKFLSKEIKEDSLRVLLYHVDSLNFTQYKKNELEKIFTAFN